MPRPDLRAALGRLRATTPPRVPAAVAAYGLLAFGVWALDRAIHPSLAIDVAPYEVAGAALSVLLVLRTNAGYDRWWEARKLWGGIVNQTRNLAILGLANGPADPAWRARYLRTLALFPHAARRSLRLEPDLPEAAALLDPTAAAAVLTAAHRPTAAALLLARQLRDARDAGTLDPLAWLAADRQRSLLIDHIGACERILKTPLPAAYALQIRRFLALFLATLPFALLPRVGWLTPPITMLVAYPLLALDRIGIELQSPYALASLNHLPLDSITANLERELLALAASESDSNPDPS